MIGGMIGQYRITRLIGRGGMGAVYAAEHTLIGRPAAIKVMLPQYSQNQDVVMRFFNEARATTSIRHPGIVEVYDFGWHTDKSAYIVMEFLEGESLTSRIAKKRITYGHAMAVTRQIAGALAAAHAKGIVHRDLKPDNVFLVADPDVPGGERAKLLDFGIAKLAGDQPHQRKTRTGAVMGTPTYMAPEQCRGVPVDHRADLYSLGVILFELCTGKPPFDGEGAGDVLAAHIHIPPPQVSSLAPDVPHELQALVHQLLAKAPAERLQTADEVIRVIDAASAGAYRTGPDRTVFDGTGPQHKLPSAPPRTVSSLTTLSGAARDTPVPATRGTRSRTVLIAALAAGAIGAAIIALAMSSGDKASDSTTAATTAPATAPAPGAAPAPGQPEPVVVAMPEQAARAPQEATPPAPTQTPAAPATIDIAIDSTPHGAHVLLDGKQVGTTPYNGTLPKAERDVKVVLRLAGHKDKVVTVRADAPIAQKLVLEARPKAGKPGKPQPNRDESVNPFKSRDESVNPFKQ